MRSLLKVLSIALLGLTQSCGSKSADHSGHDMSQDAGANQVLYNQVMDIHDEVMPFTESLYNISKELKTKQKEAISDSVKMELSSQIRYLDSVNNMMMDWMRKFNPPTDTSNEETARAYYETELEKIKKVKEAILEAKEKFPAKTDNEQ